MLTKKSLECSDKGIRAFNLSPLTFNLKHAAPPRSDLWNIETIENEINIVFFYGLNTMAL